VNKKIRNLLILLMVAISLVFSSCATSTHMDAKEAAPAVAAEETTAMMPMAEKMKENSVAGVFVEADKYGNLLTSITKDDLDAVGLSFGDMVNVTVEGIDYVCPIVSTYSDVDVGDFLLRAKEDGSIYFAINYGNCAKKTGAVADMPLTISMNNKGAYLLEYQTRHLEKSEVRSDYASDAIFANFREVKTSNIGSGILYRSASPVLGDARAPYADKLAMSAGIKTIVNLADSEESMMSTIDPNSWYKTMYDAGHVVLLDMDVDYSGEEFGKLLGQGFKYMAVNEPPYLVHCNEGKDRAGFASVILEALMGADLNEITSDYMMSYSNYYGVQKGTAKYNYIADTPYNMLMTISNGLEVTDKNLSAIAYDYMIRNGLTTDEIVELMGKLM
jgi:protein tyrosine/serine phosphatase